MVTLSLPTKATSHSSSKQQAYPVPLSAQVSFKSGFRSSTEEGYFKHDVSEQWLSQSHSFFLHQVRR